MEKQSIMLDLKKTNKKIMKMLSNRYKILKLNITPIQSKILMFIFDNYVVTANDIGKYIHANKSSLSKVLNNLEKNGYIDRIEDKTDTRKKIVKLTNKSLKIIDILERNAEDISKELMLGINKDEYETFKRVLDKVEMNIERMTI